MKTILLNFSAVDKRLSFGRKKIPWHFFVCIPLPKVIVLWEKQKRGDEKRDYPRLKTKTGYFDAILVAIVVCGLSLVFFDRLFYAFPTELKEINIYNLVNIVCRKLIRKQKNITMSVCLSVPSSFGCRYIRPQTFSLSGHRITTINDNRKKQRGVGSQRIMPQIDR